MANHRLKLSTVVAKGDRRSSLEALAVRLSRHMDDAPSESYASLARQLAAVVVEIELLPASAPAKRRLCSEPLVDVVARGDRREISEALAVAIATHMDAAPVENYAGLARQLVIVLADLDGLKVPVASKSDELARRRAARQSEANPPTPTAVDRRRPTRG